MDVMVECTILNYRTEVRLRAPRYTLLSLSRCFPVLGVNPQNLSRLSPNSDDQTKTSEDHGRPGPEDGREGRRWVQDGEEGRSAAESRGAKVDVLGELTPRRRRPLGGADPLQQPLPRRRARDGAGWH